MMKKYTILRRVAPIVALLTLTVMMASSCASTNKYGCPNHLESSVGMP
ncbi:MAG: hypothetical protein H6550_15615 [Chitinophagales bacterium]|nr:hypothetical protein [Chitinophagales bacterium]